jgi:1-acyl-sn-glycerol-3-phosphate acyltransferase
VAAIYKNLGVSVVPIALNSGLFWSRRAFVKRPGHIIMEVLPAIPPGLPRDRFVHELRERIEGATVRLCAAQAK